MESHEIVLAGLFHLFVVHTSAIMCVISLIVCVQLSFCEQTILDGAEMSGHFGTITVVPKCLRSEVSWVRSVLTPTALLLLTTATHIKFPHENLPW